LQGNSAKTKSSPQYWGPPDQGGLKIKVDGSFYIETSEGGITSKCHDSSGRLVDSFAHFVRAASAVQGEALAIVEILSSLQSRYGARLGLESDLFDLIRSLTSANQVKWEISALINEPHAQLRLFSNLKPVYCRREYNKIANWITKAKRKNGLPSPLGGLGFITSRSFNYVFPKKNETYRLNGHLCEI